ncbi:MAG: sulfatase-like hydrolase/transferase [Candidatus Zapsychrus exili]|nr:sulfatase-like hydrolase/transferase [Candidatus Zapsychrus exili]
MSIVVVVCALFLFARSKSETKIFQSTGKKNVIFIGLDSLQYNLLSKDWGYEKDISPSVSDFLNESICFTNAWTSFARTNTSYMTMLTGRYPVHNGVRANLLPERFYNLDNIYLGKTLQEHGYYTFHATDDTRFSNIRKFHGFDELFHPRKDVAGVLIASFYDYAFSNILLYHDIFKWAFKDVVNNRAHPLYNPKTFVKNVISRLNKLPADKPKFMVFHFCATHHPYTSPFIYGRNPKYTTVSEECIKMADDQFAMLLNYIKKSGLYDNSLIFVFSDHGSGWDKKRRQLSHGTDFNFLWANRVVLSLHKNKLNQHKKIDNLVRNFDIYPTVLELLGIDIPENIDGKSLIGLMEGKEEDKTRTLIAETGYSYKYIYSDYFKEQEVGIQDSLKSFAVDSENGCLFIKKDDYYDLVLKKWYMYLEDDFRIVHNPWYKKTVLYDKDNNELLGKEYDVLRKRMLGEISEYRESWRRIDDK